jgi:hypothetical protein
MLTFLNAEDGATADQTNAEIKTAYEANSDTNEFSDAEQTKLSGIETSATADQTGSQIKTLYQAETSAFTDAQFTKLAGIETSATADQTGAQIKTLYQAESNAFTDAQFTKLAAIESSATVDQTGAEIKTAYQAETNAFTDAQFTKLAAISGTNTGDQTLPTDFVSKASGGTFSGAVTLPSPVINTAVSGSAILDSDAMSGANDTTLATSESIKAYVDSQTHGATLTSEQVQDIAGGMFTGNTETGVAATYQDGDGTIDLVVGTLNQNTTGNADTATALAAGWTSYLSGDVTATWASFDGAQNSGLHGANAIIQDNKVDEARLMVSNAPTNGYVLTAQSAATGDMTWEEPSAGDPAGTAVAMAIALG